LLETPVAREEEEDTSYVTSTSTQHAPERTWGASEETEEAEEEEESHASWRRDGDELPDDGTSGGGQGDWRDTVMADIKARRSARESWEPIRGSKEEPVTVATTETLPPPPAIAPEQPSAAPFGGNAWPAPAAPIVHEEPKPAAVESAPVAVTAPVVESAPAPAAVEEKSSTPTAASPTASMADNWFSPAPSPWDAELKKANELAAGWDSPKVEEPVSAYASEETMRQEAEAEHPTVEEAAHDAGLSSSAVEAIREEAAQIAEAAPVSSVTGAVAEPKMDDLVAKVLAKMSPDVLQAVTREILKPVVEAMVRDELNAKKS